MINIKNSWIKASNLLFVAIKAMPEIFYESIIVISWSYIPVYYLIKGIFDFIGLGYNRVSKLFSPRKSKEDSNGGFKKTV